MHGGGNSVSCSSRPEPGADAGPGRHQLPEGEGKEIVQTACAACHSLGNVTNSGHSVEEWKTTVAMMLNVGATVPPDKVDTVLNYLVKNFPEKPAPPGGIDPRKRRGFFQGVESAHAGLAAARSARCAGWNHLVYRGTWLICSGTSTQRRATLRNIIRPRGSGPHGLVMDKQGNIWFTANFKAYIGRFDPKTGKFTEYPLDPEARDPHTPIFDQKGTLWFTVQGADMVGPPDPETGDVKNRDGSHTESESLRHGGNHEGRSVFRRVRRQTKSLASIRKRMAIHEYLLPDENARPRRVAITTDDVLYYSDYGRGYLAASTPSPGR